MSEQAAKRFIDALETLEASGNAEPIISIFGENCEVGNVASHKHYTGKEGAKEFWKKYRGNFEQMRSHFRNVVVQDNRAALEWTTDGTAPDGTPLSYSGVTVLEMDGDEVTRCQAYFDTEDLGRQMAKIKHKQAI
jgi:hypothetical protein